MGKEHLVNKKSFFSKEKNSGFPLVVLKYFQHFTFQDLAFDANVFFKLLISLSWKRIKIIMNLASYAQRKVVTQVTFFLAKKTPTLAQKNEWYLQVINTPVCQLPLTTNWKKKRHQIFFRKVIFCSFCQGVFEKTSQENFVSQYL